jgi:hypothetical protein
MREIGGLTEAVAGSDLEKRPTPLCPKSFRWLLAAVLLFGVVCRLSQYAANTSVWHDEAFVALNVLHKTFAGLLGPLDWNEPAPPGFLMLEKIISLRLGKSEYALRLAPLLAGLAGMACFARLAKRISGMGPACLWAVLLMAASAKLIVQSNEIKHFTLDLLCAVLLTWLAIRIWSQQDPAWTLLFWGSVASVGFWFSYANTFVFAGTSLVLAWRAVHGWRWPARLTYLGVNLGGLVSFWLLLGPIRAQRTEEVVTSWRNAFPDLSHPLDSLYWLGRSTLGFFNYLWQPFGVLLLLLAILGGIALWQTRRKAELMLLVSPVLFAMGTAAFRHWPFGGNQHMVFAAPAGLLLAAEGVERLRRWPLFRNGPAAWILVGFLLLPGIGDAAYRVWSPRFRHEVRPAIEFVRQHFEPGDQVIALDSATVEFYVGRDFPIVSAEPDSGVRAWLIFSGSAGKGSPIQDVVDHMEARRPRLLTKVTHGAAAMLFGPESTPVQQEERE